MTIDQAILLEDALDMFGRGFTKEQFVSCVSPCAREANAAGWDEAMTLIKSFGGSRAKATNHVQRELDRARDEFFPA